MDDLVSEFLTETNESLDELDVDLVTLEQNPNDKELLSKIFRMVHTVKGTCGFLGLPRLEKVAHHAENVLGRFRDGDLDVTPEYVTLIFESIDRIKMIVAELGETGKEPEGDDSTLIEKLDAVYEKRDTEAVSQQPVANKPPGEGGGNVTQEELDALEAAFHSTPGPNDDIAPSPPPAPETVLKTKEEVAASVEKPVTTQTLRVNVDVLETLMTMVSELVLTRNQLIQILRKQSESEFSAPLQRLNHVVSDLQEGVMKTRMQPIGNAWSKLPRIIRDLSLELGKKINLEMNGQDTELDRQVLELIKDPLTHMVRNSGDHGIEDPETRKASGKAETGTIRLNAFHEGGHIIIKISDDGKGLSAEKIKTKVIESGLASAEELEDMSPNQINQFIFKAGFSTAEKVTAVSGRGVGMDVVRTNIEKIGGSVDLKSVEGQGSTFTIKIPLTLAIVSALIVEAAKERFAIPQLAVRELVMVSENGDNQIEYIKGTAVFRLRDRLLPLVSLSDLLKLNTQDDDGSDDAASRRQYIVVSQVGMIDFGIIVDRVYDTEEIVVKPVAQLLRDIELFSGNTILGDGSVIMILDPNGIANHVGQFEDSEDTDALGGKAARLSHQHEKTALLLFRAGTETPKAVPLSLIERLENIDLKHMEYGGDQALIQYRGQLMPLMTFDGSLQTQQDGEKPILVFTHKDKTVGIVVDEIIDICEEYIDIQLDAAKQGLFGSSIINGKTTDVMDIGYYLKRGDNKWFQDHDDTPYQPPANSEAEPRTVIPQDNNRKKSVLLVDDSAFFRNMLEPLLRMSGYDVMAFEDAREALKLADDGIVFDIVVSDIEMPHMDGFEFAQAIRSNEDWQDTPLLALSSHTTPEDMERGRLMGFNNYIAKFDRDALLEAISKTIMVNDKSNGAFHPSDAVSLDHAGGHAA